MPLKKISTAINNLNTKAKNNKNEKYIDLYLALMAVFCCGLLAIYILFITPILGVGDDGTLSNIMLGAGLDYPAGSTEGSSYFIREYIWKTRAGFGYHSIHTIFIQAAKRLDYFFTRNRTFDIRFLGLIYLILYLPAIGILVKALCHRLPKFAQKIVPFLASIIIFADISYITYFNSLYAEPLIFICLLYMVGTGLSIQKEGNINYFWISLFTIFTIILSFIRQYCFIAGISGIIFLLFALIKESNLSWKVTSSICILFVTMGTIGSLTILENDFNQSDKLHSMTRGVLMESTNPEDTLKEFGISPSYSLLTDVSTYDEFPATTAYNSTIESGFLIKYDAWDILLYYFKHPANLISMINKSTKTNTEITRENCGNYEISANMPAGARSIFWSSYSIFKNRSLPKTIGFIIILIGIAIIFTVKGNFKNISTRKNAVYLDCILMLSFFAISTTTFIIVQSGEVALMEYNGQLGIIIDFLLILTITQTLEFLNIL